MAAVLLARRLRRPAERIPWQLKDRSNPFELEEKQFKMRFRLSREVVMHLCLELEPYVEVYHTGFSLEIQVLIFLRIIATGSFQSVVADGIFANVSQSTTSRSVKRILKGMMHLAKEKIKYPTDYIGISQIKHAFFVRSGFPNVIGAIDCSHILINRPRCSDWFVFLNRKNHFTVNVQMVCDANTKILDVVARWPGSSHDSFIWRFSSLRQALHTGHFPDGGYLLGDSGYPLEPWLLTPYMNACCPQEVTFNGRHASTRNVIERCFGILKSRFRMLHSSGGTILYDPPTACKFIIAAAILHNICIQHRIEDPDMLPEEDINDEDNDEHESVNTVMYSRAAAIRDELALRFQRAR